MMLRKEKKILSNGEDDLFSLFHSCTQSEFETVFPGSEAPKWFSCSKDLKASDASCEFSIEMSQMFKLENAGVALYAVVEKTRNEFTLFYSRDLH